MLKRKKKRNVLVNVVLLFALVALGASIISKFHFSRIETTIPISSQGNAIFEGYEENGWF